MGMQILKHWACTLDVYRAQPLMDAAIYSFWWGSHVWHPFYSPYIFFSFVMWCLFSFAFGWSEML